MKMLVLTYRLPWHSYTADRNTMLHFLIGDPAPDDPRLVEVAVVFDKWSPEARRLIGDLRTRFISAPAQAQVTEAA